jgi:acetylornithine deacetylase/succinyl-diaminopimelate desuccinylase-like protein
MADALLDELFSWLRIPSISTGGGLPADLTRAAEWVCERVEAAGGEARLVDLGGNPIAYGELRAKDPGAPTVIAYGHYDVQGPGPLEAWTSDPFEPDVRDGRIYARGASDDKGNCLPLLHVACELARAGELPVTVRVVVEGEEEAGGASLERWIAEDDEGADCAIVWDSGMADAHTPAITVGLRGIVFMDVTVRTGRRDLHSGLYGGTVVNANHVLHRMLAEVLPDAEGRVRAELMAGVEPPAPAEIESWRRLVSGEELLAEAGGRPVTPTAGAEFYERTGALPSVDLNRLEAGAARTIVPASASASVSMRLAPRQSPEAMAAELERLMRAAAPEDVEIEISTHRAEPALFEVDSAPMQLTAEALERACGVAPAFVRSGGSIPVVAQLAAKGIPVIVGGFALPEDEIHAPDESYRLESLRLGEATARELLPALARLPRR